jgi:hypothetical protein
LDAVRRDTPCLPDTMPASSRWGLVLVNKGRAGRSRAPAAGQTSRPRGRIGVPPRPYLRPASNVDEAERWARRALDAGDENVPELVSAILIVQRRFDECRNVAHAVWRQAVHDFARWSAAVIVDVTISSESLQWEITTLLPTLGHECVLVGRLDG